MEFEECWVEIENFPRYAVSDHGRIMNVQSGRILKPGDNGHGYLYVFLWNGDGQPHRFYVHQLVVSMFEHIIEGEEVNHDDGIKSNNSLNNLKSSTRSENIQHAFQTGLNNPNRRRNVRPVRIVETGDVFDNAASCARAIGGRQSTIQKLLHGIGKSHLGYTFQYAD